MVRRVSSADAERHFAELMDEVASGDTEIIIEEQGRPLAALVSIKRVTVQPTDAPADTPATDPMLALVGSWGDVGDDAIDEMVAQIYETRDRDRSMSASSPNDAVCLDTDTVSNAIARTPLGPHAGKS